MPARLIDEERGVGSGRDLRGDFREVQVHGLGVTARHDERGALAILRTDRPEDIGRRCSLILGSARARTAFGPSARDLVLLADARFIREPDLYAAGIDVLLARDLFQAGG
jgi:hypothetical protein